ncbi:MAG: DUF4037 domain-containing protein [Anaeroplasmataceae bacterium]|nr:DUF4037 domain-containing protein [Anaeroplasmataceae bacterium]MDE6415267.1 DUF4037 domain-containing protein [Anaeroplasmataceae bacterium]
MVVDHLLKELNQCVGVEAIAIGGSRASGYADKASDYDVYVYYTTPITPEERLPILKKYCKQIECNNTFWETEDNCIMNDDIPIDIIYRNLKSFEEGLEAVVFKHYASNGYTTCLWHNVLHSVVFSDKTGSFKKMQDKFNVAYPQQLRSNIITKNSALLNGFLPSYFDQIKKAIARDDKVSINHRTTEFLASYFDIIFALNYMTHPGEKRLISICKKECKILPEKFEENLNMLFDTMFKDTKMFMHILRDIIDKLEIIIVEKK